MAWQKCPVCNGGGSIWVDAPFSTSAASPLQVCPTCLGRRIIDEATGEPPPLKMSISVTVGDDGAPA